METTSEVLSRYATNLRYEDLSDEVVCYEKQLLLDTLGVALGGYINEPSNITRSIVRELGGKPESTIIGSGDKTSCSLATLANGVMVRYLDFMDIYVSVDVCHPSENIPVALAVGERQHSSGKDVLLAMFLGFELQGRFSDTFQIGKFGWHHVTAGGYVTPIVAGKLLGLDEDQMANAVGIAGSTSHTLSFLGGGHISMIKALGYAFAAQRGAEAALMAMKGMTGPHNSIELFNKAMNSQDLTPLREGEEIPRVLKCALKPYASEFMTHAPLEAMFGILKEQPLNPEDIERIHVKTFEFATRIARKECYKPETRELADHSMPYCLAIGLIDGDIGPEQFAHEQWKDPKVLELMSKIEVTVDPELNKLYPKARPVDLEIHTKKGKTFRKRVDYPKGDPNNPMSDVEIQDKFCKLAKPLLGERKAKEIIDCIGSIEVVDDIGHLMGLLTV